MNNLNKWRLVILISLLTILTIALFPKSSVVLAQTDEPNATSEPNTAASCSNLLSNGDMEADHSWQLSSGGIASTYVEGSVFAGQNALLVGPPADTDVDRNVQSTAWQAVRIPASAPTTLSFWYRPETDRNPGSDRQYIGLIDTDGTVIELFVNELASKDAWQFFSNDVTRFAGRTLWVYFGVENDGWGGSSRLFVDEVQLCSEVESDSDEEPITVATDIEIPDEIDLPGAADIAGWEQLGFEETLLQGPYGSKGYRFGIPADWSLKSGAELSLDLQLFNPAASLFAGSSSEHPVGNLNVSMNGVKLPPVFLSGDGDKTFILNLPNESLISYRSDGKHELVVGLESEQPCDSATQISVLIKPSTQLLLPHNVQAPLTDLRLLPRPLYQDSFEEDAALIVVPAEPSAADLQAALAVAAGFSRMTKGNLLLSLITADSITAEMQESTHLIMVGAPDAFTEWKTLPLPARITNGRFQISNIEADDGVVQMVASPWNPAKVIMIVSGHSEAGIIKAGQAVSSGLLRVGTFPNMATVTDIQVQSLPENVELVDETFESLGYAVRELDDRGINYANYYFTVPPGHVLGNEAYFELFFNHSALLNYERSGLLIDINGEQIGSVRFEEVSTNVTQAKFDIPRYVLNPGDNELLIKAELMPQDNCLNPNFEGLWLSISPESNLHLPLSQADGQGRSSFDLDDYPSPFDYDLTLADVTMVVPRDDLVAWQTAVQLAAHLGDKVDPPFMAMSVAFADDVPEVLLNQEHLILVGEPNQLEIMSQLSEVMPAPFIAGSNLADENNLRLQYRLPGDSLVGYLQFFPSPWNQERAILSVVGSSSEAVQWAANALTQPRLNGRLKGNLAIVQGEQVLSGLEEQVTSNAQILVETAVSDTATEPPLNEEVVESSADIASFSPQISNQFDWILDAVWIVSALMGAVVLITFLNHLISRWRRA